MTRESTGSRSRLGDDVGPFYSRSSVLGWLSLTKVALDERVRAGSLIECVTSDGVRVYPTFQFKADGEVIAGIDEITPMFIEVGLAGWTLGKAKTLPMLSSLLEGTRDGLRTDVPSSPVRSGPLQLARVGSGRAR